MFYVSDILTILEEKIELKRKVLELQEEIETLKR